MFSQSLSWVGFDTPFHHVETPSLRELLYFSEHGEVCNHAFMTLGGFEFHPNVLSTRAPLM